MIDRKRVYKGLWAHGYKDCKSCPYWGSGLHGSSECKELAREALSLLREQDAVEPREQEETRTWIVCGNCSQHLISKWLYCPNCGKAVKWNDK